ncbi:DUF502 domain-containing protein [Alphaproteobacteria bacterium KMM 3653]|uniref:DUF502 domain-containing protein n=1 Tax=Harenicola maris TaxID=2841044 RepID=A0AAP2CMA3_9RHOB|nr:DUF502 domain-containing protein [Harenicola maris]
MSNPLSPTPDERPKRGRPGRLFVFLRSSFLTGLVVVAPIGLTFWLIWAVVGWVDGFVLPLVPNAYHPEELVNRFFGTADPLSPDRIHVNIRGVGVVVFLAFTILVGWLAKGVIGRSFLHWAEGLVGRTPVVRSIYSGVKQIAETVFSQQDASFEQACLVQYPREGVWAIAFISTTAKGEIRQKVPREDKMVSVFLPTTPNPTSGFLLFIPEADVIILDMTVEDAAKLVISAGLVYPNGTAKEGVMTTPVQGVQDARVLEPAED